MAVELSSCPVASSKLERCQGTSVVQGEDIDMGTMQIGEVAEKTQLSLRTIRHYDEVGLVPPSGRSEGGFRLYTQEDVDRLTHVRRITPLGFSLEETAEILAILEGQESEKLPEFVEQARASREKLARKLRQADELIQSLQQLQQT